MPIALQKRGSILLIDGLDTSNPGEYISDNAATLVQNFSLSRGLLKKRIGISQHGGSDYLPKLQINFTGADDATTYTAETGQTITFAGTAKLSGNKLLLDGNSDYISAPHSADWDFSSGKFSLKKKACFSSLSGAQALWSQWGSNAGDNDCAFKVLWESNVLNFLYSTDGVTVNAITATFAWTPVVGVEYDLEIKRDGADLKAYVDDVQIGSTHNIGSATIYNSTRDLIIGASQVAATYTHYFNGLFDDEVILKGVLQEEIMGGRELIREGVRYNVRVGLKKISRYNSGTSLWVDITGSDLTGSTNDLIDTAIPVLSGKQILCITNGIDAIRKWLGTGNTADLGGSPPVAKFIQEYKTYLVCANIGGGVDIGQRVQWCDTAAPETWGSGNAGSQDLIEEGDDISGLSLFGDYLAVHKPSAIYLGALVSSNDIFRFDRCRGVGKGTIANHTIVNLPTGEQIYLADDGIRLFNGVSANLIAPSVSEEIRDGLNKTYAFKSWGVLVSEFDEVWLALPIGSQTTPDTIYKYNYLTGKVHKDTRSGITAAWRAITAASSRTWAELVGTWAQQTWRWSDAFLNTYFTDIFLGDSAGLTYKVDNTSLNDGSSAISAIWSSKDYQADEIGQLCRWSECHLWAKGTGSLTVEYSTDGGSAWYEMSGSPVTLTADFPSDSSPIVLYFDTVASTVRVRFRNNATGETVSIKQFKLGYKPREFRR